MSYQNNMLLFLFMEHFFFTLTIVVYIIVFKCCIEVLQICFFCSVRKNKSYRFGTT